MRNIMAGLTALAMLVQTTGVAWAGHHAHAGGSACGGRGLGPGGGPGQVPVTQVVNQQYQVQVPVTQVQQQQVQVQVPEYRQETRQVPVTVMRTVPQMMSRQVVTCCRVPCIDPCTGCVTGYHSVPSVQN